MLFKSDHRKKSSNPVLTFFRLLLSLVILVVLGVGLVQAYKAFSGYDPASISPQSTLKGLLTSEGAYNFLTQLLTFNPKTSLEGAKNALQKGPGADLPDQKSASDSPVIYRFAVMADSHLDYNGLKRALVQAKEADAKFVVAMGDLSDVGTIDQLTKTKSEYDASGLTYYISPGDHDMWDARNQKKDASQNFIDVFGNPYQSFTYQNTRFIIINNSDNYSGVDSTQMKWIEDELEKVDQDQPQLTFVVADMPLFHPSSDHVMGKVDAKLKAQADHLLSIFSRHKVDQIFSADTHVYSSYLEPTNNLKMVTVGAITSDRNPQAPRYITVDVHEDGSYNISQTEIK